MQLFDSHAHLTSNKFDNDRAGIIDKIIGRNMKVIDCSCEEADFENVLANSNNAGIYSTYGVHPHEAKDVSKNYLKNIEQFSKDKKCVAIGEIGLDYHYEFSDRATQKKVLIEQLELAQSLNLPVVLHDRESHSDMYEILNRFKGKLKGVMHCFSGGIGLVKPCLDLGLYIGFTGVITFDKSKKANDALAAVPNDKILIETDSPYMAPTPFRGKRNNPLLVEYVCEQGAKIKNLSKEDFAKITTDNALKLFNINN